MARRADELGDRRALAVLSAALGVVVGLIVGALSVALLGDAVAWSVFLTSAGFGGAAAVAAALIAFAAAAYGARSTRRQAEEDRRQLERQRRKEQWWARAEWALTEVARGGRSAIIGLGVLEALGRSEWADQHEADIIAAATDFALETEAHDAVGGSPPTEGALTDAADAHSTAEHGRGTMDRGGDDG
jgi:predicted lysophospholipase L1 biosynthesis ABC-type transport system permease subunit